MLCPNGFRTWKYDTPAKSRALCRAEAVDNFSGQPGDPRPADWVRPADGSGQPGSNDLRITIAPGCPLTVSSIRLEKHLYDTTYADGHTAKVPGFVVIMTVQNYTATPVEGTIDEWILDQDGKPIMLPVGTYVPDPSGRIPPGFGGIVMSDWEDQGESYGNFGWWKDSWDLTRFTYRAVIACHTV